MEKMDEKIIWNEAEGNKYADGNPYIGPNAVLKGVFTRIMEDHEYFTLIILKLDKINEEQVFTTLRYKAKVKKNGAVYNIPASHLWTLKDGKITAFQQFVDTKKLNDVLNK